MTVLNETGKGWLHDKLGALIPYIVLFFLVIFMALRIFIIRSDAFDIAGIEQNVIYSTQVLLDGGDLYPSPGEVPFSITQYTPLFYYVCGYTASLMGFGADDIGALYAIGRSWNLLFNLITAWLVFKIGLSILSLPKNTAYVLFLLAFVCTFSHNFAARPDSLQDTAAVASLYTFLLYLKGPLKDTKRMLLVVGLTVLLTAISVFTKQSGIQMIIIFLGFCLLVGDWRGLFTMALFSLVIYGGFLLLFTSLYPFFLDNVVGGIANGISIDNFLKHVIGRKLFIVSGWPLIVVFLYLLIKRNLLFKGDITVRMLAVTTLGALVFASVTALKMGATTQYYVLFINLALLFLLKIQHDGSVKLTRNPTAANRIPVFFGVYVVLVTLVYGASNVKLIRDMDHDPYLSAQRDAAGEVAGFIRSEENRQPGTYIFANLTTNYSIASRQGLNSLFFRQCLVPQMDILEYSAGPLDVIGYDDIRRMLEDGEVGFVIVSVPRNEFVLLDGLDDIMARKFTLVKEIDGYQVYKFSLND